MPFIPHFPLLKCWHIKKIGHLYDNIKMKPRWLLTARWAVCTSPGRRTRAAAGMLSIELLDCTCGSFSHHQSHNNFYASWNFCPLYCRKMGTRPGGAENNHPHPSPNTHTLSRTVPITNNKKSLRSAVKAESLKSLPWKTRERWYLHWKQPPPPRAHTHFEDFLCQRTNTPNS